MSTVTSPAHIPDKTVLITGASGNLGTVVTNHFLSLGYKVIAAVHNDASKKDLPKNDLLFTEVVDLANEEEAETFIGESINKHLNIDAAILLVGGFAMGNMAKTTSTDVKKQISLNFETAFHVARPAYQHMLENNYGRIVFIGARPPLKATDGKNMIAYALSKSLLFKLAEFINADAKGKNITATVIVPSTIDTEPNRKAMPNADPSNWVKPETIAEIIAFAISDTSTALKETVLKVYNNA